jgi:hypothetical protein
MLSLLIEGIKKHEHWCPFKQIKQLLWHKQWQIKLFRYLSGGLLVIHGMHVGQWQYPLQLGALIIVAAQKSTTRLKALTDGHFLRSSSEHYSCFANSYAQFSWPDGVILEYAHDDYAPEFVAKWSMVKFAIPNCLIHIAIKSSTDLSISRGHSVSIQLNKNALAVANSVLKGERLQYKSRIWIFACEGRLTVVVPLGLAKGFLQSNNAWQIENWVLRIKLAMHKDLTDNGDVSLQHCLINRGDCSILQDLGGLSCAELSHSVLTLKLDAHHMYAQDQVVIHTFRI